MSATSSPSLTSLRTEGQLRNKIKELQEKRAAGLMSEISELQKERSVAITQVKKMDSIVADIRKENAVMKQNERNFVSKIQSLERLLLEEKLISANLKKKHQTLDKKNKDLMKKLESMAAAAASNNSQQSNTARLNPLRMNDRSHSMSDLSQINQENQEPNSTATPNTTGLLSLPSPIPSPTPSPSSSPSVIHRRYRLATLQTSEQQTQTTEDGLSTTILAYNPTGEKLSKPVLEILASAREDILMLQQQKKELQKHLQKLAIEKKASDEAQITLKSQIQIVNEEADILREGLSQFSGWVQAKLSVIEDDMDLCKVIYSLHNSLSKEANEMSKINNKLSVSESSLQKERIANKELLQTLQENEQTIKQLQTENSELREQLKNHYGTLSKINELKMHTRNLSLPSPLTKHKETANIFSGSSSGIAGTPTTIKHSFHTPTRRTPPTEQPHPSTVPSVNVTFAASPVLK